MYITSPLGIVMPSGQNIFGYGAFRFTAIGGSQNVTTGTFNQQLFADSFTPTTGTGIYNALNISNPISQSAAATGVSRGIFISPTLTRAQDYRAIETTTGSIVFGGNSTQVIITGSLTVITGSNIEFQVLNTGVRLGNIITDTHTITGSLNTTGSLNITGSITASGIISIGRSTTSQAVIQRAQTPAGAYSFILASGTGIVDTFPYTMTDAHGATLEMRAGDPTSDQYGGGILITANGNTSPLGEGNAIVFKNRTGTDTYTERMRITHDGKIGIGTSSPASLLDVNGGDIQTSNSLKIGDSLQIEQRSLTRTSRDTITASTTGSTSCDEATSQSPYTFRSMHIKYNIQDATGGNYRAGTVMAITDGGGTNITSIDTATSDIGNTSTVTLSVILTNSGQNMTLQVVNGLANDVDIVTEYTML